MPCLEWDSYANLRNFKPTTLKPRMPRRTAAGMGITDASAVTHAAVQRSSAGLVYYDAITVGIKWFS